MITKERRKQLLEAQIRWRDNHKDYASQHYLKNREKYFEKAKAWAKANPDKKKAARRRWRDKDPTCFRESGLRAARKAKYGINDAQYAELLAACKNKCGVCGVQFSDKIKPHIDHCHNTNVVRGFLCRSCNIAEGVMKTPDNARKLYEYMLKNSLFYQGSS